MPIAADLQPLAVPIEQLHPLPGNPRRGDVEAVARSYATFGQRKPLVARRDGTVIAGNHQLAAALQLGWTELAVVWVDDDDATANAFALADNRTADLGTYDPGDLLALIRSVQAEGDDSLLAAISYDEASIAELIKACTPPLLPTGDEDDVPEAPTDPVTQSGDLWLLGEHRLLCGDATVQSDLDRLMDGAIADLAWTDPPYNADYSSRVDKKRRKPWGGIANDNMTVEAFDAFLEDVHAALYGALADGGSVYVWTDWKRYPQVARVFAEAFTHKGMIVWDKGHFGLGTYYRTQHEVQLFGCKGPTPATWNAAHDERDVWSVSRDALGSYEHPTQKPVELAARAILNSSNLGETVLDLFGGSGSALIACAQSGRVARLLELSPTYCDVICHRYERYTGIQPVLASTGEAYSFVPVQELVGSAATG